MKKFVTLLTAIAFNCLAGAVLAQPVDISPVMGAVAMNGVAFIAGMFPAETGILRAGVYVEIWTGELIKALREGLTGTWLDGIPDMSSLVENDVIHLVDVGADPDVLIDNTSYPLDIQTLPDGDKAISLSKFETKPTSVTDDELYAISYDKMGRVKESHSFAIKESQMKKAAHALCAASHTAKTPVIATTGDADPNTGRNRLTRADLIALKGKMDALHVPANDRRLVLCPDHVQDILLWSETFEKQYSLDNVNGKVGRLYGFDIYEFSNNPYYSTAGVKKNIDASPSTGEFQCSFAFYTRRVFKATGSTKMYYSPADQDPLYHRNLIDFLQRFVCLPKKADAGVVIYSGYSSGDAPTISGDQLIDNLAATAGSSQRTYATSNGAAVTAQSDADWLTVTVGSNGKTVTFTRTAYAYAAAGANPRVANVTIAIPNTSATLAVVVKQAMASE